MESERVRTAHKNRHHVWNAGQNMGEQIRRLTQFRLRKEQGQREQGDENNGGFLRQKREEKEEERQRQPSQPRGLSLQEDQPEDEREEPEEKHQWFITRREPHDRFRMAFVDGEERGRPEAHPVADRLPAARREQQPAVQYVEEDVC